MYNIHVIKLCRIVQCTIPVRNTLRVPDAVPRHRDSQWRFVICCVEYARYLFNCPDIILYHQCIKLSLKLKCMKFHVIQDSKMSLRKNVMAALLPNMWPHFGLVLKQNIQFSQNWRWQLFCHKVNLFSVFSI